MLALCSSGSSGSQNCGQKFLGSLPFRQVLIEPPRRPCTNIMSISGSGEEWRSPSPRGPRAAFSSSLLVCFRAHLLVNRFLRKWRPGGELGSTGVALVSEVFSADDLWRKDTFRVRLWVWDPLPTCDFWVR